MKTFAAFWWNEFLDAVWSVRVFLKRKGICRLTRQDKIKHLRHYRKAM